MEMYHRTKLEKYNYQHLNDLNLMSTEKRLINNYGSNLNTIDFLETYAA
jgi:hypothetical protein